MLILELGMGMDQPVLTKDMDLLVSTTGMDRASIADTDLDSASGTDRASALGTDRASTGGTDQVMSALDLATGTTD
jgi:hypothetical protein